ncbi:helix-turn-helix domain-containing protein [Pseudomonas aeruginosa]|uniref:helix-turn-helix domain-containing protein n=1 Tax=Pseudomonas aeruginosa TaxID=287 RepID=UPI00068EEEA3|nr:helix-turn-helix transcriptional regulator [Pseudomonas aeruginosa]EJH4830392.1 helix-turn-helix transcriptional regulator [Pseudomonas aeruginosa]EKX5105812.1 helix-turn-helix transcriptional regulator [Pseudomonas aeruginosa]EKX8762929.1 helix-turn-helix transcriptional regulator [Pseudomonas aeruginosa]EMC2521722.1 helix-turn-helix transcriptional regulator [Pseudomonas aeruginosa]EMF0829518.1 helix-turn-helix transcriptional regulator [Pseudomonas aeruginosa]
MKKERRELEDWEKQECASLKAAIADFNAGKPREKRITQEELAHELKMSQGTLNSHLNGSRPLNKEMAAKIYLFMGIPASRYSKRLADELEDIAKAVPLSETTLSGLGALPGGDREQGDNMTTLQRLKGKATPRSLEALKRIEEAAMNGHLKEEDIVLLEGIAARFEELNKN